MRKYISFLSALLVFTLGCSGKNALNAGKTDVSSEAAFEVTFVSPTSSSMPQEETTVTLSVNHPSDMMSLQLSVDGTLVKNFNRMPFDWTLDPVDFPAGTVTLKAEAMTRDGSLHFATLVLGNSQGPTPGSLSSRGAGVFDPECLNNGTHDACIFWKNPVAQRGSAYPSKIRFGQNLTDTQTFGVQLTGMTNPSSLRNSSIRVTASSGATAQPTNGRWIFDYRTDQTAHATAQVMAYFWLTLQEKEMLRRSGTFFARNRNIPVDAYNASVIDNAYWDGGGLRIVMGAAATSGAPAHEMALSAEVYLHEMGHANLQFAVGGYAQIAPNSQYETCTASTCLCRTLNGCIGAINEGQADFHFLMMFGNETTPSTALGETWLNSMNGLASRNVASLSGRTASQQFASTQGQVHGMGALYASILWQIYTNPQVTRVEFEKIFMGHLQMLTGSSRFQDAREALIAVDAAQFNNKYRAIIQGAFASRGL